MTNLVSAIMPTGGRPNYVTHAIGLFLGQTHDEKELIILDDSLQDKQLPKIHDSRIRHVRLYDKTSIGAKHDMAIGLAAGNYICHWDDDDWFSPHRLEIQVAALKESGAELCGFMRDLVFLTSGQWGRLDAPGETGGWIWDSRMMYSGFAFHDGTAMFKRSVLREIPRYGNMPVGQKVAFLNDLVNRGVKHVDIPNGGNFVYIRHGDNNWQPAMERIFRPCEAPQWFPEKEFEFYTKVKAG